MIHLITMDSFYLIESTVGYIDNYNLFKLIFENYPINLNENSFWMKYEKSDYYSLAYSAYQWLTKIWDHKEINNIENEILDILDKDEHSYWWAYYYRYKFFETWKLEYLVKLKQISQKLEIYGKTWTYLLDKELLEIQIIMCDAILESDISKINRWIELSEIAISKKENKHKLHSLDYVKESQWDLSYEGLLNLLEIYKELIVLSNREIHVYDIKKTVLSIFKIIARSTFIHEYDLTRKAVLKFKLFSILVDIENTNKDDQKENIEVIDEILNKNKVINSFNESEIEYFEIAKEIFTNLYTKWYLPKTDYLIDYISIKYELPLDTKVFFLALIYIRNLKLNELNIDEKISKLVYESLIDIWRKRESLWSLPEEWLRDVLSIALESKMKNNLVFTEAKTWAWKTDIYIVSNDGNKTYVRYIFECLIWQWKVYYQKKKKQLTGYLDVNDKYAWLITFSKNRSNFWETYNEVKNIISQEEDYIENSIHDIEYIKELNNFVFSSKHRNSWGKILDLEHFFVDVWL